MRGACPFQGEVLSGLGLSAVSGSPAGFLTFRAAALRRRKFARKFAAKRSSRVVLPLSPFSDITTCLNSAQQSSTALYNPKPRLHFAVAINPKIHIEPATSGILSFSSPDLPR